MELSEAHETAVVAPGDRSRLRLVKAFSRSHRHRILDSSQNSAARSGAGSSPPNCRHAPHPQPTSACRPVVRSVRAWFQDTWTTPRRTRAQIKCRTCGWSAFGIQKICALRVIRTSRPNRFKTPFISPFEAIKTAFCIQTAAQGRSLFWPYSGPILAPRSPLRMPGRLVQDQYRPEPYP